MKILAKYWRYWFRQDTTETMDYDAGSRIAIRSMPWKLASGNLTYGTVITEDLVFGAGDTIVDGGITTSTVVDNSVNLFYGVNGTFEITHDHTNALGNCSLFVEFSDDDVNWPSQSTDHDIDDLQKIALLPIDNSGLDKSRSVNFKFHL